MDGLSDYFAGFPAFLAHLGVALGLLVLFLVGYTRLTPHREWLLIHQGVLAASIALVGSTLGYAVQLASAIAHSVNLVECVLWGFVGLVLQWLVLLAVRMKFRNLSERIADNDLALATLVAGLSLAVGVLSAACMTG